ncbi:MAG: site-2 protease family protein [Pseudomonadota bacterium]
MFGDQVITSFRGPLNVPVEVHSSYLFLVVLILVFTLGNIVFGIIFLCMLTLSIFLHEFGHAWASKAQGVPVRRVVIHGGGGFCETGGRPTPRQQEFIVAMGPVVNLILWAVSSGALELGVFSENAIGASILQGFSILNLFLFIFNLLPMLPLDGGRLTQLVLLRVVQPIQATRISGLIALLTGALWVPAAIFLLLTFGFILVFIPNFQLYYQMWKAGR